MHGSCKSLFPPSPVCHLLGALTREFSSIQLYFNSLQKSISSLGSTRCLSPLQELSFNRRKPLAGPGRNGGSQRMASWVKEEE